tara:strand:- start:282 stop:893 length:612 start_codon:yes stop_codon:yes gene_type:complete
MATLNATNLKHASSSSNNIVLAADGSTTISNLSGGVGKVLQVVQTIKTDIASISVNGGSFGNTDSSFAVTITPSSTSSLIYLNGFVNVAVSGGTKAVNINYRRGGADLTTAVDESGTTAPIGDAAGSRKRVAANGNSTDQAGNCFTIALLDKPASTSAQTYSLSLSHGSGSAKTMYINEVNGSSDSSSYHRSCSVFIAMEIAA